MARRSSADVEALQRFTRRATSLIGALTSPVVSYVSGIIGQAAEDTGRREITYQLNWANANVVPDPAAAIAAFHSGRITRQNLSDLLGYQGIGWYPDSLDSELPAVGKAWNNIVDLARPTFDNATLLDLWRQGRFTDNEMRARLKRSGLSDIDIALALTQRDTVDVGTGIDLRNQGLIDDNDLKVIIHLGGVSSPSLEAALLAQKEPLGIAEIRNRYYLGFFTDQQAKDWIAREGFADPVLSGMLLYEPMPLDPVEALQLHYRGVMDRATLEKHIRANKTALNGPTDEYISAMRPMPTPSDLVTLAVRDAWNLDAVNRFQYDEEFPEPFRYFMDRQGMDWGEQVPPVGGQVFDLVKWPLAYWRAHWQLMSPTQGYDAYHRLRPGRIGRYAQVVPGLRPFVIDDLRTLLKTADYPKPMRDWLAALAFSPLRLTDIRSALALGEKDHAWAVQQMLDRGLLPEDAETSVRTIEANIRKQKMAPITALQRSIAGKALQNNVQMYVDGYITREQCAELLNRTGMGFDSTEQWLLNAEIEERHRQITAVVKGIRADYDMGAISDEETIALLATAGIVGPKIAALLQEWRVERSLKHRMATSGEILGWVKQGLMTPADAQLRLANLGWNAADALLALQSAGHALAVAQGRQAKAAEQAAAQKAKQLEKASQELTKARRKVAADLKAITPIATLKSWYVDGVVGEAWIVARMTAMLYPQSIIGDYLKDWNLAKEKKANAKSKSGKPKTPQPPPVPPGGMQGG